MSAARGTVAVAFHDGSLNGATLSVLRTVPFLEQRGWRFDFWGPPGGALAEYLEARGHRLHGVRRQVGYSLESLRQPPGVPARLRELPGYLRSFRRFLRDSGPQLVHANTLYTMAEGLIARANRIPALLHVHEMLPDNWKGPAGAGIAYRAGMEIVAVSEASAARCVHRSRRPRLVYEGAEVPPKPAAERPSDGRVVVGTIGVVAPRKGSDLFVEAVRRVRQASDEVDFRLVGEPSDPLDERWGRSVLDEARRVGVRHLERVDVVSEICGWDIFVLPSRRDPFPIVVLEAMASGLPVVGTRVDGLVEQVTSQTGILCEPDDPDDLARAILELAADPQRRQAMGAAARRRVADLFTVERQAEGMHAAYLACLGRRRG